MRSLSPATGSSSVSVHMRVTNTGGNGTHCGAWIAAPRSCPARISRAFEGAAPIVTMPRVPGAPLGTERLTGRQLAALAEAVSSLFRAVPADIVATNDMCIGHPRKLLAYARRRIGVVRTPDVAGAVGTAMAWLASSDAAALDRDEVAPVFGRGDNNLTNCLWDGDRMRLMDFEDSGRSDRPAEIAALVEHLSARCTPDTDWDSLIRLLDLSHVERGRLLAARRLHAVCWLLMLLPGGPAASRNPAEMPRTQAERVLGLLDSCL